MRIAYDLLVKSYRGTWTWLRALFAMRPFGPAPVWAGVLTSATIGFTAMLRGLDLVTNPPPAVQPTLAGKLVPTLNYYLEYTGAEWFGSFMLVTALVVAVGLATRRPLLLALGHAVGAGVYAAYLVAIFQGLLISQDPGGPFAGLRTVATGVGAGMLHLIRFRVLIYDVREAASERQT